MAKTATVQSIPGFPSPERAHLAEAIACKRAIIDRLIRINSALEVTFVWDANEAVERAEQALNRARTTEPQRLTAGLIGDPAASGPSVEQATWALEEARADYQRALQTREALDAQRNDAERDLSDTERSVREAIRTVVRAEGNGEKELALYRDAQAEVARRAEIIALLDTWNCLPPRAINLHPEFAPARAERPWREALAALETDANAQLPE